MTLKETIFQLLHGKDLSSQYCENVVKEMLQPQVNVLQAAVFLMLLRNKTETAEELIGMINALKKDMIRVEASKKILDIVGTGGDGAKTVNISTGSAILAASCGIKIAKHGNHAVSSSSGSADVLTALGISLNVPTEKICSGIEQIGIGFFYAPNFHPAFNTLRSFRRQLNLPTAFNLIAPLLNPANPSHYLLGVFDKKLLPIIATVLKKLGTQRSWIVHGHGLDEISCVGTANIIEVTQTRIKKIILDPKLLGFPPCEITDLQGGDAKTNAQLLLNIFQQSRTQNHAIAHTLILNAGVALYLYGLHKSLNDAIKHAKNNLYSGNAFHLLKQWREYSHD